jgi:hypothetical protein
MFLLFKKIKRQGQENISKHIGANVFCFLSSVPPLLPPAPTAVISLLFTNTLSLVQCGLAYPYDVRGFVRAKTEVV